MNPRSVNPTNGPGPERRHRALVVDDDSLQSRSLARLLARQGWEVREAASLNDAIAALRERPVELLVSDYAMPGQDGVTLVRAVRDEFPSTICIFYSATIQNARIRDALEAGVVRRHFTKGEDLEQLLHYVRRLAQDRP